MADDHGLLSSPKHKSLRLFYNDMNFIKLLKDESHLLYDGTRVIWTGELHLLKNYVESTVGWAGNWFSPGGRAKQFKSQNHDLTMTWYPGKLNSLLFHGKDGDMFKEFLVSVLEQTKVYTDCLSPTVADALLETEPPLVESIKTVSENSVDPNPSPPENHTCACRSYTANLKDVKLDIAVIQKQIESINRVIDSTNNIIESMSVILSPSGTESHQISYDLRVETLLREFSSILTENWRNEIILLIVFKKN